MKDLLSKEHYCYKIHTSLSKSTGYPACYKQPLYGLPPFLQENPDSPFLFFKNVNPL